MLQPKCNLSSDSKTKSKAAMTNTSPLYSKFLTEFGSFPNQKSFKSLLVEKHKSDSRIALVTLNRPNKKNAFHKGLYTELGTVLKTLSYCNEVGVILITGSGEFYSSGNDLSNFSQFQHPLAIARESRVLCEEFVNSFIDCRKPIVAAVNGPALGIAATTLGLTDYVLMSDSAYLLTPFQALGQTAEGCSTRTFPKLMGDTIAHEMLHKNKKLSAAEAKNCGFAFDVSNSSESVLAKALEQCQNMLRNPEMLSRKIHENSNKEALILKQVNSEELKICEKSWICEGSFKALSEFLFSRKMYLPGLILRIANMTGFLWGQPKL